MLLLLLWWSCCYNITMIAVSIRIVATNQHSGIPIAGRRWGSTIYNIIVIMMVAVCNYSCCAIFNRWYWEHVIWLLLQIMLAVLRTWSYQNLWWTVWRWRWHWGQNGNGQAIAVHIVTGYCSWPDAENCCRASSSRSISTTPSTIGNQALMHFVHCCVDVITEREAQSDANELINCRTIHTNTNTLTRYACIA